MSARARGRASARAARAAMATLGALVVTAALAGCAASPPAAPTIDDVIAERSETLSDDWREAAARNAAFVRERWPDAEFDFRFERWVPVEQFSDERADCVADELGRPVSVNPASGSLLISDGPPDEEEWVVAVADIGCALAILPWSNLYLFAGETEQAWVREQLLTELPECARRLGGSMTVPDLQAAIDGALYPTAVGRTVSSMQSVWPWVQVQAPDPLTTQRILRVCPDPGRVLTSLDPPEVRP